MTAIFFSEIVDSAAEIRRQSRSIRRHNVVADVSIFVFFDVFLDIFDLVLGIDLLLEEIF